MAHRITRIYTDKYKKTSLDLSEVFLQKKKNYFFLLIVSTTAVFFQRRASFTGINFPVMALRPILMVFVDFLLAITELLLSMGGIEKNN